MTKEEIAEALESGFWKECIEYLSEQKSSTKDELMNLDFRDEDSAITAHGLKRYVDGIDEIFEFVEKIKKEAE